MLVEISKTEKQTVELPVPCYAKTPTSYYFVNAKGDILTICLSKNDGVIFTHKNASIGHAAQLESVLSALPINNLEFEDAFKTALNIIAQQIGLESIQL